MNRLLKWYSELNIYLKLVPFLILYSAICILFPQNDSFGDEGRYLWFSNNLLHGFYSPPYPDINLWNGPGYPLLLMPFIFLKLHLVWLRLANAVLLYFSLILSYKTIKIYTTGKIAFVYTVLLGLYFPIYEYLRTIVTESLTWFLISLITFLFVKNLRQKKNSWKLITLCALSIAYLAMTKIIFGYVILIMLLVSVFMLVFSKIRIATKKSVIIFFIAFVFCLPWLLYTYNITNKIFYWGNSGSMSLYTMSTPYEGETGDWYDQNMLLRNPNHAVFIDSVMKLEPLKRDEAFKNAALQNIKNHPKKYVSNVISNVGRLLFFPSIFSPESLKAYLPFVINIFVFVFIVFGVSITILLYRKIPVEIIFLLIFILVYLTGSCFLSAYRRMFFVTMPFWIFFSFYIFNILLSVKVREHVDVN